MYAAQRPDYPTEGSTDMSLPLPRHPSVTDDTKPFSTTGYTTYEVKTTTITDNIVHPTRTTRILQRFTSAHRNNGPTYLPRESHDQAPKSGP